MRLTLLATGAVLALAGASRVESAAVPTQTPTLCVQAEVKHAVRRFVAAFNRGSAVELGAVWAREPDFQWYSTGGPGLRVRESSMHRPSLVPYFLSRHRQGERLKLLSIGVNGNSPGTLKPYGNFEYRLIRSADDLSATAYQGKGALHCYADRANELIVWSMARAVRN